MKDDILLFFVPFIQLTTPSSTVWLEGEV